MTIQRLFPVILMVPILGLQSCEKQLQKRVVFQIESISLDNDVVAQGNAANITATFIIDGTTNERSPSVSWESDLGSFESANRITTIWTAPPDFLGDVKIKLTATFMGHTDVAERVVRIVKTPADSWGSLSGYIYNESQSALSNVIVMAGTGESDTTDNRGYFYLGYLPQGSNGLEFFDVPFAWATELPQEITITGGSHLHLGNILFYSSAPAEIQSYQVLPGRQAILSIEHTNPDLIDFHELYRANAVNGSGAKLLRTIEPEITEIQIQEESANAFYALKSVPVHGDISVYSDWTHISFINVVDPDADGSYFDYENFFSATINWQSTGYEDYYKGFKIVEDRDTGWVYVSPLLGTDVRSFQLSTYPGQTGDYYILAISADDLFNETQPEEQIISLEVPSLKPPQNFGGTVLGDYSIRLLWEPVANDNSWYSGYLLEKKVVTDTSTVDWEVLTRVTTSITTEFSDEETDPGNVYHYRISSVAYPPEPGTAYYSAVDSIGLSTK